MDRQSASAQHGVPSKARLICTCSLYFSRLFNLLGLWRHIGFLQAFSCSSRLTASFFSCNGREELLDAVMWPRCWIRAAAI